MFLPKVSIVRPTCDKVSNNMENVRLQALIVTLHVLERQQLIIRLNLVDKLDPF